MSPYYQQYYKQQITSKFMPIILQIKDVNNKLKKFFPNDPHTDIRIIYNTEKVFKLKKSYLRLESDFFKQKFGLNCSILQINQNFDESHFQNIMGCFYGGKVTINQQEVIKYFQIALYLKTKSLIDIIKKQLIANLKQYDIFAILQLSHQNQDLELFNIGIRRLEDSKYGQLIINKNECLKVSMHVFKYIIKSFYKWKNKNSITNTLTNLDVYDLIKSYRQTHEFNQEDTYNSLCNQLIDKNQLSSDQYQKIFMEQIKDYSKTDIDSNKNFHSKTRCQTNQSNAFGKATNIFTNSNFSQIALTYNTLYKKKTNELLRQNQYLKKQIQNLKDKMNTKSSWDSYLLKLKSFGSGKIKKISTFEQKLRKLEQDMNRKNQQIQDQNKQIQNLKIKVKQINIKQKQNFQALNYSQSKPFEQEKQEKLILTKITQSNHQFKNDDQIPIKLHSEDNNTPFSDNIEFSEEPISIHKDQYDRLVEILQIPPFKKLNLNLLYRASQKKCERHQFFNCIKERQKLLFLIEIWESEKNIGALISTPISQNQTYVSDPNAFIFTLNYGKKYKTKSEQSIYFSEECLISFGEDLIIKQDCLKEESECNWPTTYEGDKSIPKPQIWLTGARSFQISELEVFQIMENEMEMNI